MKPRPLKCYIAEVMDGEGMTYEYVCMARNRRHAADEAGDSVKQWGATLVGITPAVDRRSERRRLFVLAGTTLTVGAITMSAMMIIGLSLEGAL